MSHQPPPTREGRFLALLAALAAFGPLSIDLYLPALPTIAAGLATTAERVQLSVTVFLAGFAVGMLFYGPLSDRYGRRAVMLGGTALFVVASVACMAADSVEHLILARFFQAIGGGAASILSRAVVRDVYATTEAIRKLSLMAMVTAMAPLLAPLAGSVILGIFGWRGTFAALVLWGILSLAMVWFGLPETLPPEKRGGLTMGRAFAAYGAMLGHGEALGLLLAGGMSFAAMFAYITASPHYFIDRQGFSPLAYGCVFAANAFGIFLANYVNSRAVRRAGPVKMLALGCLVGFAGSLLLLFSLSQPQSLVPGVIAGLFVVVSMTGLLGANCVGLLMTRYPQNAGAAAALFGATQFGLGMIASAAVSALHDGAGRSMGWVITAACALAIAGAYGVWRAERHRAAAGDVA